MKKTLIIYAVIFALTIIIPAIVCFSTKNSSSTQDMVNLFRSAITQFVYCH